MLSANPSISSWPSRLSLSKFRTACQQVIPATMGHFSHGLPGLLGASSRNFLAFANEHIVRYFCHPSSRPWPTFCLPYPRIFRQQMNSQVINRTRRRTAVLNTLPVVTGSTSITLRPSRSSDLRYNCLSRFGRLEGNAIWKKSGLSGGGIHENAEEKFIPHSSDHKGPPSTFTVINDSESGVS